MCGIAGFVGKGDEETGKRMIDTIGYRGPDHRQTVSIDDAIMAHARLSIIDLSEAANQPMFSRDRRYCIVFNGEIYNFQKLKANLIIEGYGDFQTSSDTEVLLSLYARYGRQMLFRLNGMFAIAIYDSQKKELFLARDRMGKKPLYYSPGQDAFVFGSEIKAVLAHPSVTSDINEDSLSRYLTFDYVPGPETMHKNVFRLEPATYLIYKEGKIEEKGEYWQHDFTTGEFSLEEAIERFDQLMNDAVERRLISDVPLGIFLSGGLDSSTVAYYAAKNSGHTIKTFSIGFDEPSYDEQEYASLVAKQLGTEHHSSVLTAGKTLELIDQIYPLVDEPFADASLIPTYYLSAFTKKQVTVALGGDGSDELLAGYPTFVSDRLKGLFKNLPRPVLNGLLASLNLLPASDRNISFDFKARQFLRGFMSAPAHTHQLWLGSFLPEEKKKLLLPDVYNRMKDPDGLGIVDYHYSKAPTSDKFHKTAYYYYKTYLPDDILFKVDRASMYNSLEVRAPFLDVEVVEFLNTLPSSYKRSALAGKYILKKMMRGRLPDEIIDRPKKGFGIPLSSWIRKELKSSIEETLLAPNPYFNKNYIEGLLKEHQSGKSNHRKQIWNLFMFLKWHEQVKSQKSKVKS